MQVRHLLPYRYSQIFAAVFLLIIGSSAIATFYSLSQTSFGLALLH